MSRLSIWLQEHLPDYVVSYFWGFCSHHDRIVTRWHHRRCRCRIYVLEPDDPQ
jgi:hypothetical protein